MAKPQSPWDWKTKVHVAASDKHYWLASFGKHLVFSCQTSNCRLLVSHIITCYQSACCAALHAHVCTLTQLATRGFWVNRVSRKEDKWDGIKSLISNVSNLQNEPFEDALDLKLKHLINLWTLEVKSTFLNGMGPRLGVPCFFASLRGGVWLTIPKSFLFFWENFYFLVYTSSWVNPACTWRKLNFTLALLSFSAMAKNSTRLWWPM